MPRRNREPCWGLYRDVLVREMYSPGAPGGLLAIEASSVEEELPDLLSDAAQLAGGATR